MRRYRHSFLASLLAASFPLSDARAEPTRGPAAEKPQSPATHPPGSTRPAPSSPSSAPRADTGLSPEAALARATAFYEAGQYAQCADAFAALLDDPGASSTLAPRAREQASVYRAACLIAVGQTDAADEVFREAIRQNPQMATPNAIVFPQAVIERFVVVRTTLLEEIRRSEEERAYRQREAAFQARRKAEAERARVQRLEKLADQETIIVKNRRWLASVPFGIGQLQNREYALGTAFLVTELMLVGTAVTAVSIELSLNSQAKGGVAIQGDVRQLNQNLRTAREVSLIATGAFLVVAGGGIVQANLAFVPEFRDGTRRRVRTRQTPGISGISAVPIVGGAALGLVGRF